MDKPKKTPPREAPLAEPFSVDKPISPVYPEIDTDLARDNIENDIPEADLQDL